MGDMSVVRQYISATTARHEDLLNASRHRGSWIVYGVSEIRLDTTWMIFCLSPDDKVLEFALRAVSRSCSCEASRKSDEIPCLTNENETVFAALEEAAKRYCRASQVC